MIVLRAFEPQLHNQNGDSANLTMIARVLESAGIPVNVSDHQAPEDEFVSCDLALVGDASLAAIDATSDKFSELPELIKARDKAGRLTLIVGSSYERLAAPLLHLDPKSGPRFSGFAACAFEGSTVWGYVNSVIELPRIYRSGSILGTQFFGPLLARNPWLARQIITGWVADANCEMLDTIDHLMKQSPNFSEALQTLR